MERRWGVLKLVGGVENAGSGCSIGEPEEEEEEARVIDTTIGTPTTPISRRQRGPRWIITLEIFPGMPIPWEIRLNLFPNFPPLIRGTSIQTTITSRNRRNGNSRLRLLLNTSQIPSSTPFIAPFLALLILAARIYSLSFGGPLSAGWRGTSGSRRWIFVGDDQVMLEPTEDAAVEFSGFGGNDAGGDDGRRTQGSGENWEDLELVEWDGGGRVLEWEEL